LPDKRWKSEERAVARLLGGSRYPANQGGRVDVESPRVIAQVKHRRVCSLAELERLAVELEALGRARGKLGVVVVKRRAGAGRPTPRLIVCTEQVWRDVVSQDVAGVSGSDPCRVADDRPLDGRRGARTLAPCRGTAAALGLAA
jgi:hypothetical protein